MRNVRYTTYQTTYPKFAIQPIRDQMVDRKPQFSWSFGGHGELMSCGKVSSSFIAWVRLSDSASVHCALLPIGPRNDAWTLHSAASLPSLERSLQPSL